MDNALSFMLPISFGESEEESEKEETATALVVARLLLSGRRVCAFLV
jgi:hypothetical protein